MIQYSTDAPMHQIEMLSQRNSQCQDESNNGIPYTLEKSLRAENEFASIPMEIDLPFRYRSIIPEVGNETSGLVSYNSQSNSTILALLGNKKSFLGNFGNLFFENNKNVKFDNFTSDKILLPKFFYYQREEMRIKTKYAINSNNFLFDLLNDINSNRYLPTISSDNLAPFQFLSYFCPSYASTVLVTQNQDIVALSVAVRLDYNTDITTVKDDEIHILSWKNDLENYIDDNYNCIMYQFDKNTKEYNSTLAEEPHQLEKSWDICCKETQTISFSTSFVDVETLTETSMMIDNETQTNLENLLSIPTSGNYDSEQSQILYTPIKSNMAIINMVSPDAADVCNPPKRENLNIDEETDRVKLSAHFDDHFLSDINVEDEFNKQQKEMERKAEMEADHLHAKWKIDKKTLAQVIDETLRDHHEMYVKAHALRKHFEHEKVIWKSQILQILRDQNTFMRNERNGHDGDRDDRISGEKRKLFDDMLQREEFLYDSNESSKEKFSDEPCVQKQLQIDESAALLIVGKKKKPFCFPATTITSSNVTQPKKIQSESKTDDF